MPFSVARIISVPSFSVRAGYCCGLASLLIMIGCESLQNVVAEGDTRTISFHHVHTDEDLTITYKKNGRYDEEALKKINWLMRDWRKQEPIKMNPHVIDLLWEVHREVGAKEPIWVVCGYRSPGTNAMLRRRSSGVAKFSQHMLGNAIDFYIPGVPLDELRSAGLRAQRGGVGFYPTSGSPFVHLDTGNVRHWPRMPEEQLARILAKGPLTRVASNDRPAKDTRPSNPLARLLGIAKDEDHEAETAAPAPARSRTAAAKPEPTRTMTVAAVETPVSVPLPKSRPAQRTASFEVASATSKPVTFEVAAAASKPARPAQSASLVGRSDLSANEIINQRGFWQGLPELDSPPPPSKTADGTPIPRPPAGIPVASADPDATGVVTSWPQDEPRVATAGALAYAAPVAPPVARPAPIGAGTTRSTTPQRDTTIAVKRSGDRPSVLSSDLPAAGPGQKKAGTRLDDPWMRAMIVSPNAQSYMNTTMFGTTDFRSLTPLMQRPSASVMMTFTDDPNLGMTTEKFTGTAVVFVATVSFNARTAALR